MTTTLFLFIGDTLTINANAAGGSIRVEALDSQGNVIPGFSHDESIPCENDAIEHVLAWNNQPHCAALQARTIQLRFHLRNAALYAIEPHIRFKHLRPLD